MSIQPPPWHGEVVEDPIPQHEQPDSVVRSPFAGVQSTIHKRPSNAHKLLTWIGIGTVALVLIALAAVLINNSLNNPLRTLKDFPVEDYYENHSALEGGRYKGDLRVVNSLGWKEKIGRLVVFEVGSAGKQIVILIPPSLNETRFDPGDKFTAELRIGEGGLITANYLKKG